MRPNRQSPRESIRFRSSAGFSRRGEIAHVRYLCLNREVTEQQTLDRAYVASPGGILALLARWQNCAGLVQLEIDAADE